MECCPKMEAALKYKVAVRILGGNYEANVPIKTALGKWNRGDFMHKCPYCGAEKEVLEASYRPFRKA